LRVVCFRLLNLGKLLTIPLVLTISVLSPC
jgi:hypothetical protein